MNNPNQIKFGFIKSSTQKGYRTTVYFPDGNSQVFTASNDLTAAEVVVMGDRVFSNDPARSELTRTTELFKSSQNLTEEAIAYPWTYLFEINDFDTFTNSSGEPVEYTDTSWVYDDVEGLFRPFGDGGGEFKTRAEILDFYSQYTIGGEPYYRISLQHQSKINFHNLVKTETGNFSTRIRTLGVNSTNYSLNLIASMGDGLYAYTHFLAYGANEKNRTSNYVTRPLYPDRNYWVKEFVSNDEYRYVWSNEGAATGAIIYLISEGNSNGENKRIFMQGTRLRYIYTEYPDGTWKESGYRFSDSVRQEYRDRARTAFAVLDTVYTSPVFELPPKNFDRQIYTGQQILDEEVTAQYPLPTGTVPDYFEALNISFYLTTRKEDFYQAQVYLIPEIGDRTSGVKQIFCQVGNNPKTLLHSIPSFEPWQGFISPIGGGVEVVIKCGKKFMDDPLLTNRRIREFNNDKTFYDREWAQTRVYRLNPNGKIIDVKEYNNSETDRNPSLSADSIVISEDNWQKPWLDDYSDYRTVNFRVNLAPYENYPSNNLVFVDRRTGTFDDLVSAYRTYYSDLQTNYLKAIPETSVLRYLTEYTAYGTLTDKGMIFVDPHKLFDPNVALDFSFSFGTNLFPSQNYAVISALYNSSFQDRVFFQTNDGAIDSNNNFIPGVVIEKGTTFPKLDIGELNLPELITRADWNIDNPTLLRIGLAAIAYLG